VRHPLVKTAFEESIYTVTLARPAKRNAINDQMLSVFEDALQSQPHNARVIVFEPDVQRLILKQNAIWLLDLSTKE